MQVERTWEAPGKGRGMGEVENGNKAVSRTDHGGCETHSPALSQKEVGFLKSRETRYARVQRERAIIAVNSHLPHQCTFQQEVARSDGGGKRRKGWEPPGEGLGSSLELNRGYQRPSILRWSRDPLHEPYPQSLPVLALGTSVEKIASSRAILMRGWFENRYAT